MTADIEILPLPKWLLEGFTDPTIEMLCDYTRANVEHYTATKDAEIEALRAERDSFQRVGIREQERAERLAEALREKADKWDRIGDEHGVRQFTGNDHKLFANELRALLHDHDQEGGDG